MKRAAIEAARRKFTPELINRLDKMIVFHPLGENDLQRIVEIELARLQDRILTCSAAGGFVFRVTDRERARLLEDGVDSRYGARHLRRTIERHIVQPLSNLIASGQVRMGDVVEIDDEGEDDACFNLLTRGLSMQERARSRGLRYSPCFNSPRRWAAQSVERQRAGCLTGPPETFKSRRRRATWRLVGVNDDEAAAQRACSRMSNFSTHSRPSERFAIAAVLGCDGFRPAGKRPVPIRPYQQNGQLLGAHGERR